MPIIKLSWNLWGHNPRTIHNRTARAETTKLKQRSAKFFEGNLQVLVCYKIKIPPGHWELSFNNISTLASLCLNGEMPWTAHKSYIDLCTQSLADKWGV